MVVIDFYGGAGLVLGHFELASYLLGLCVVKIEGLYVDFFLFHGEHEESFDCAFEHAFS